MFQGTFAGCSSLTTLPDGIFAGVSGSDNLMFYSVFSGCKSLSKINSDLFAGVGGVCKWTFLGAFKDCTSLLTIPEGLFRGISKDSIFAFIATFSGCKSLTGMTPKIQGKDLWAVGFVHKDIGNGCFKGCTKLSDYNEIPDDWK